MGLMVKSGKVRAPSFQDIRFIEGWSSGHPSPRGLTLKMALQRRQKAESGERSQRAPGGTSKGAAVDGWKIVIKFIKNENEHWTCMKNDGKFERSILIVVIIIINSNSCLMNSPLQNWKIQRHGRRYLRTWARLRRFVSCVCLSTNLLAYHGHWTNHTGE